MAALATTHDSPISAPSSPARKKLEVVQAHRAWIQSLGERSTGIQRRVKKGQKKYTLCVFVCSTIFSISSLDLFQHEHVHLHLLKNYSIKFLQNLQILLNKVFILFHSNSSQPLKFYNMPEIDFRQVSGTAHQNSDFNGECHVSSLVKSIKKIGCGFI